MDGLYQLLGFAFIPIFVGFMWEDLGELAVIIWEGNKK